MDQNKQKALDAALGQIERQFGKGAIMKMGEQPREAIPAISTGSLNISSDLSTTGGAGSIGSSTGNFIGSAQGQPTDCSHLIKSAHVFNPGGCFSVPG